MPAEKVASAHTPTMATPEERAIELKNQGNKAFAAHDWPTAIEFYTRAIELNDKEPTFWSNRSQVRTLTLCGWPPVSLTLLDRATDCVLFRCRHT